MEVLLKINNYILDILDGLNPSLSITELALIFFSLIISLFLRNFFAKIIIKKIKKIFQNKSNKEIDYLFDSLIHPLKILPIILVFLLIGFLVNTDSKIAISLNKINQSLITFFIFWIFHQFSTIIFNVYFNLENYVSKVLAQWLVKSIKYLIIFLGVVAILDTWGIKIGPVLAGLGLFGVALALGAQDLFKNLISGIMIILEKRFGLNDVIEVQGQAVGIVEHIGFRSTLIRRFDSTPISIPNYIFSDTSIINFTNRRYRRIQWIIGLTYDTSITQLKNICYEIEASIRFNKNFIVDDSYKLFVRIEKFNDSSIDIFIHAFTNTNDWEKYLEIKEDLICTIKQVVENNNSSFAYPSQSIYLEKK